MSVDDTLLDHQFDHAKQVTEFFFKACLVGCTIVLAVHTETEHLADGLGNLDYVAREIVKAEDIIDYTRHENVAERLAKRFGAAIGEGAVRALQTMPAVR